MNEDLTMRACFGDVLFIKTVFHIKLDMLWRKILKRWITDKSKYLSWRET